MELWLQQELRSAPSFQQVITIISVEIEREMFENYRGGAPFVARGGVENRKNWAH